MGVLSETAQQWVNVVLIWIGFGTLAGLLARAILPGRDPAGAVATLVVGITGSTIGLLVLSYFSSRFWEAEPTNPISPVGLLAATGGAFVLLAAYRVMIAFFVVEREETDVGT